MSCQDKIKSYRFTIEGVEATTLLRMQTVVNRTPDSYYHYYIRMLGKEIWGGKQIWSVITFWR